MIKTRIKGLAAVLAVATLSACGATSGGDEDANGEDPIAESDAPATTDDMGEAADSSVSPEDGAEAATAGAGSTASAKSGADPDSPIGRVEAQLDDVDRATTDIQSNIDKANKTLDRADNIAAQAEAELKRLQRERAQQQ